MTALAAPREAGGVRAAPVASTQPRPLTVCYPFCGDELGGSHHSARGLMEGLDPADFRVLIVPERPEGTIAEFFSAFPQAADPAPLRRTFVPGAQFGPIQMLRTLAGVGRRARFLRANGVDLVHSNDGRTHASWALAARLGRARLVWHHRGDPEARGLRYLAPLLAHRIFTVSHFALPRANSRAARLAQVAYSPFDTSVTADRAAMRARLIAELGLPEDAVICGFFGNFVKRKRPLEFVDAVERLGTLLGRPVAGLFFGDPRNSEVDEELPARIAAVQGPASIHMMGYRSPGHEWLAGCDLLLVPAAREPLGRTLVEAMLVGTLVVATDSGGNPEALEGGCGVLCPLDDADAMARAAADLLGDPVRMEAIRTHAHEIAKRRFSREAHVAQISAAYATLAGAAR